nr:SDR family NAD(P)-dependent oxidoreductase [Evansella tamaricis]
MITGTNRGLGFSMTKAAVKRGYTVFAGVRSLETEHQMLQELQKEYPEQIKIVPLDVSNENSLKETSNHLKEENVKLDVIVNNAGILFTESRATSVTDLDLEEGFKTFDINTFGPIRMVKHFMSLLNGEGSKIINISSDAGRIEDTPWLFGSDYFYGMSKTAVNMFTEKLRRSEPQFKVVGIHPGWCHTDMGGKEAPLSPDSSAEAMLNIIDETTKIGWDYCFVDYEGNKLHF